jgi:hypothetical protein
MDLADLADLAQTSALTYREVGERHGWRKGRNSSRGYDALTIPLETWDDRPQQRYLALLDHHLSSAAEQLEACASCARRENAVAAVVLAREVFVESSKAMWLLDDSANWMQRAARAHLELFANVDGYVRRLPKRTESGHPDFHRRRWKEARERWQDDVIAPLFGKRAMTGKRVDVSILGETLMTSAHLRDQFATLSRGGSATSPSGFPGESALLIDPSAEGVVVVGEPVVCGMDEAAPAIIAAAEAWLRALGGWVRYNAWDEIPVVALSRRLAVLR